MTSLEDTICPLFAVVTREEVKKLQGERIYFCDENFDGVSAVDLYSLINVWKAFTHLIEGYFEFESVDVSDGIM